MNNKVKIVIESPLLRPGIKLSTEVSVKYTVAAVASLMDIVREINAPSSDK